MTDLTRERTLSEFIQDVEGIIRMGGVAEVILTLDEKQRPIRLLGFTAPSKLSDFEIYELAFEYFSELRENLLRRYHTPVPIAYADVESGTWIAPTWVAIVVIIASISFTIFLIIKK